MSRREASGPEFSGVREGGFGIRILYAGVIFPSKIQRIKNFKRGGGVLRVYGGCLRSNFEGPFSGLDSRRRVTHLIPH